MRHWALLTLAVALASSATALRAQVLIPDTVFARAERPTGTIRGTVQTSDGKPVVDAQVIVGGLASVRANNAGSFFLLRVPRGSHTITVRTFAAPPLSATVAIAGGDTATVAIRLLEKLTELETVRAIGQRLIEAPGCGALEDFYRRRHPAGCVLRGWDANHGWRPVLVVQPKRSRGHGDHADRSPRSVLSVPPNDLAATTRIAISSRRSDRSMDVPAETV